MGWKEKHTFLYNLATHSMDKIVQAFDPETGQVRKDDKGRLKIREVVDWPVSAGLTGGGELKDFFKWAEHLNNYHAEIMDTVPSRVPKGYHPLRYQTKPYDECTESLRIFKQDQREFLERYLWLCQVEEFFQPEDLFSVVNNDEATKEAELKLRNFKLGNESVLCPDTCTLHALIPYVKRLVRLFPQIKENIKAKLSSPEIRNRVYQHETGGYVENIEQNALNFKPDALGLKEFLTSDQQVWQLRMVDGDVWTGISKVYRVLQNTSCMADYTRKGHYTILKLKRLLTVNRMINLNALLASIKTPHLLMIACENNQPVNDELRTIFKKLFSIIKQRKSMKIILTTQSDDSFAPFLEQIARKAFGEGFLIKDERLAWCDLTSSSQTEILKKTVIFQGKRVALNQLTSAESMTDSFPLADLLQERELRIGEEPLSSVCSGYNEKYYIDRTIKHNIVIKRGISRDKREGKFADLLVSNEQEFKNLCKQNPKKNVHWLEIEKSGELIWRQSQGNLKTLREYIDTHISHSYAPSDLDNLLQEATCQRLMLIADSAGMGKSTVLTHLSTQIAQKSPAHWLVRIDLNDYTEQLKAQKGKQMDKVTVLEFVSKEVLKLKSHLEKELFKKSFEGNEVNKVVVMVDGFDEISPRYKETVIDMLQVMKQTTLEQLWVTTRPHLREELEDNLQQLSYSLQPFYEVEQVEFLKKFWLQNSNLEHEDEHRLEIYATALIRKLAHSISDKDIEFTGIPLQTRMLAEAFEEDFRSFYVSEKSEPELPYKLNLLGLYRRFIDSKYDIFYKEKSKVKPGNVGADGIRERDLKNIHVEHQLLALEALFTEEQVTFLHIQPHSSFSDEDLARIGIALRNHEGKPHFIHRTFAEYFVADFLINQLTKKTKQNAQVKELLLNEVLLQKDCHVIRAFLNGLLESSKPSTEALNEYGDLLEEQWRKVVVQGPLLGVTTLLHEAATQDNAHIIGFLLDSLKSGEHSNTLKVMLLAEDYDGRTAWHVAAEAGHIKVLEDLWIWVKAQLNPREFLLGQDRMEERTAWHRAAQMGRVQILQKLWEWAKELQPKPEELRNELWLSKSDFDQTPWHLAAVEGHVEVLDTLWDWAKELQLKSEELRNEVLLSKGLYNKTAWQMAAGFGHIEVLEKLWDWAKELQLKPEELRNEMWLSKGEFDETAWQKAAGRSYVDVLEKLWDWAKELQLKPEELMNDVWCLKNSSGETAWHMAAKGGKVEVLEKLWDWAKELQLKPEELKNEVWLLKDEIQQTAWHMAAGEGHVEVLEKLWDLAKDLQLKPEELMNEVWSSKGEFDQTAWHLATGGGYVEVLEKLWDWAKELQLKQEELMNEVLLSKGEFDRTAWHLAAVCGHVDILEKLWNWAKELQLKPKELRNDVWLSKDEFHKTAWHIAAGIGQDKVLQKLWDCAKELQLKPEELRNEVLWLKDKSGRTACHNATENGHIKVIEKLWDWAKELHIKTEEFKKEVWLSKDNSGRTARHLALRRGDVKVLRKLWDWAEEMQLNPDEYWN
jgi:ankyrin repeat protein